MPGAASHMTSATTRRGGRRTAGDEVRPARRAGPGPLRRCRHRRVRARQGGYDTPSSDPPVMTPPRRDLHKRRLVATCQFRALVRSGEMLVPGEVRVPLGALGSCPCAARRNQCSDDCPTRDCCRSSGHPLPAHRPVISRMAQSGYGAANPDLSGRHRRASARCESRRIDHNAKPLACHQESGDDGQAPGGWYRDVAVLGTDFASRDLT
jgi:hypothetical protein